MLVYHMMVVLIKRRGRCCVGYGVIGFRYGSKYNACLNATMQNQCIVQVIEFLGQGLKQCSAVQNSCAASSELALNFAMHQ